MTLKQIREAILAIIGPDTELQVADLNSFINEGKGKIESRILDENKNFFPDNESIVVVSGTTEITPTKTWMTIKLIQVDFGDGSGYRTLNADSLENVLGVNTNPRGSMIFCLWGNQIIVPNFGENFTMRIYGYIMPAPLTTEGQEPVFDAVLHPSLIIWGISRALESSSASEDFVNSKRKRDEFMETMDEIIPIVVGKDSTNVRNLV